MGGDVMVVRSAYVYVLANAMGVQGITHPLLYSPFRIP
jgi:hypothetical protein